MAAWKPEPFVIYRDAIYKEGTITLSVVTKHLYEGGNQGPDIYFKLKHGAEKYRNIFNRQQRSILEEYSVYFDIKTAVKDYDISLHYLLQEYVCGLSPKGDIKWQIQGTLENLLSKVHKKRNEVTHKNWPMSEHELRENLVELKGLYRDILNCVDERTNCNIYHDRSRIMDGLTKKFPSNLASVSRYRTDNESSGFQNLDYMLNRSLSKEEEYSGLKTFGKVAAGVAGVAALTYGVASLMNNNKEEDEQSKKKKKNSQEEECSIM